MNRQPTTDNSPFADPAFLDTLEKLSHDGEPVIRLRAAYVLGLVGGEKSLDRLAHLLDDPYPDVAYNAATGLLAPRRRPLPRSAPPDAQPRSVRRRFLRGKRPARRKARRSS